ncbi:hypothetical protein Tco_1336308 [Tanacetum coccineum]
MCGGTGAYRLVQTRRRYPRCDMVAKDSLIGVGVSSPHLYSHASSPFKATVRVLLSFLVRWLYWCQSALDEARVCRAGSSIPKRVERRVRNDPMLLTYWRSDVILFVGWLGADPWTFPIVDVVLSTLRTSRKTNNKGCCVAHECTSVDHPSNNYSYYADIGVDDNHSAITHSIRMNAGQEGVAMAVEDGITICGTNVIDRQGSG